MTLTIDDFKLSFLSKARKYSLINDQYDETDAVLGELQDILDQWGGPECNIRALHEIEKTVGDPGKLVLGDNHAHFVRVHARLTSEFHARYREADRQPIWTYKALKRLMELTQAQSDQARGRREEKRAEARIDLEKWSIFLSWKERLEGVMTGDNRHKLHDLKTYHPEARLESDYRDARPILRDAALDLNSRVTQAIIDLERQEAEEELREAEGERQAAERERAERARVLDLSSRAFNDEKIRWEGLGDPIPLDQIIAARPILELLQQRRDELVALEAESDAAVEAIRFVNEAERSLTPATISLAELDRAMKIWRRAVPDGAVPEDPDHDGPLFQSLEKQVAETQRAFESDAPELLILAQRALEEARPTIQGWQPGRLEELREFSRGVRETWPDGAEDIRDMSGARAATEKLERLTRVVRKVIAQHEHLDEADEQIALMRRSLLKVTEDVHDGLSPTEKEALEEYENQRLKNAIETEIEAVGEWKREVGDGLASGRYELPGGSIAGKGAQGMIFKLHSPGDPPLIGKVFKAGPEIPEDARAEHERALLDQELAIYEQLDAHPNIARVFGELEIDGRTLLVMEDVPGGETADAMEEGQRMLANGEIIPAEYWGAIQHIMRGTLQGLVHMETKGLGHNDIKPPNVMINSNGDPVLIDMGMAGVTGIETTDGTDGYIPEGSEEVGGKRDLFAVGGIARVAGGDVAPETAGAGWKWALESPANKLFKGSAEPSSKEVHYAAGLAYTKFIKATYAQSPDERPTLAQALKLPFLADPVQLPDDRDDPGMSQEDLSRRVVKKIAGLV